MDSKAIDMAYEELDEFIKQTGAKGVQLNTKIAEFKAPKDEFSEEQKVNIGGQESMSDSPNPEISQSGFVPEGGPVGGLPPSGEGKFTPVSTDSKVPVVTGSDTETANALMFIDKIAKLLTDVKSSVKIPKTAHVDQALDSLQGTLREIKNYVEMELPHNSVTEKKAARTVLSNIMKRLSALFDIYSDVKGDEELMKYIASSNILKTLKIAKTLLITIGE
jgi:hypothetical protein